MRNRGCGIHSAKRFIRAAKVVKWHGQVKAPVAVGWYSLMLVATYLRIVPERGTSRKMTYCHPFKGRQTNKVSEIRYKAHLNQGTLAFSIHTK